MIDQHSHQIGWLRPGEVGIQLTARQERLTDHCERWIKRLPRRGRKFLVLSHSNCAGINKLSRRVAAIGAPAVDPQCCHRIAKMVHNVIAQLITNRVSVSLRLGALSAVRHKLLHMIGQLSTALALIQAQQAIQIAATPVAWLQARKAGRDPSIYTIESLRPRLEVLSHHFSLRHSFSRFPCLLPLSMELQLSH